MGKVKSRLIIVLFYYLGLSKIVQCEKVLLKCEEFERTPTYAESFCTTQNLHVTHSDHLKISYYANMGKIRLFKLYDSTLLSIPYEMFEAYYNLQSLDVANSAVEEIARNTFISAGKLTFLNISHNLITEIKTSVFNGAVKLATIDLSYNNINNLSENSFKGLRVLDTIYLAGNKIKDLPNDLFIDNIDLQGIDLKNNQIDVINPEVFQKLIRLRIVDLSYNHLYQLHPDTFMPGYHMDTLSISGNYLKEFHLNTEYNIFNFNIDNNQLSTLYLNGTKILHAENNKLKSIIMLSDENVEELHLSNNSITNIGNLTNLSSLVILDLSYNKVDILNVSTFANLTKLKVLRLRNSNIGGIDYGTFSKQRNLRILDISYNYLNIINLNMFVPYLINLRVFLIDGNNLREISGTMTFTNAFPELSTLGLTKNNFNCTYLHHILSPQYLNKFVELQTEPDVYDSSIAHIRGISCKSSGKEPFNLDSSSTTNKGRPERAESPGRAESPEAATETIALLQHHLTLMKFLIVIISIIGLCWIVYKLVIFTSARKSSLVRSVVFRSNATMNTTFNTPIEEEV